MRKILLLIFMVFFIGLFQSIAQDIIVFKSGEELEAKVLKVTPTEVEYKKWSNIEGPSYFVYKSDVFMIKYQNGEKEVFSTNTFSYYNPAAPVIVPLDTIIRRNSFFAEFGGLGYVFSLNYERMFHHRNNDFWAFRAGVSPLGASGIFSSGITYNSGTKRDMMEVGIGAGYFYKSKFYDENRKGYFYVSPMLGYRNIGKNGFLFKAYVSMLTIRDIDTHYVTTYDSSGFPILEEEVTKTRYYFVPFVGVSVGHAFR